MKNSINKPGKSPVKPYSFPNEDETNWVLESESATYKWQNPMERLEISRKGLPFEMIEIISKKLNLSIKSVLEIIDIPQTTYNKKKAENHLLDSKTSELILLIFELITYGIEVFNQETDKFQHWLQKPIMALNGKSPESYLDTYTGIEQVRGVLDNINYGNIS